MTLGKSSRWVQLVGAAVVIALPAGLIVSYVVALYDEPPSEETGLVEAPMGPRPISTPFISPGLRQPPTVPARDALIPDDDEVIGVALAGVARAYHLPSMNSFSRMVINDMIGEVPATITYDRQQDLVQVFTKSGAREPLAVEVGGMFHGRLLLRLNGRFFFQANGKVMAEPDAAEETLLEMIPFQRTPWRAWRQRYPQADVFYVPKD